MPADAEKGIQKAVGELLHRLSASGKQCLEFLLCVDFCAEGFGSGKTLPQYRAVWCVCLFSIGSCTCQSLDGYSDAEKKDYVCSYHSAGIAACGDYRQKSMHRFFYAGGWSLLPADIGCLEQSVYGVLYCCMRDFVYADLVYGSARKKEKRACNRT